MRLERSFRLSPAFEVVALCVSLFCGGALLLVKVQAFATQTIASQIGRRDGSAIHASPAFSSARNISPEAGLSQTPSKEGVLGRLEIRSIRLTVPIVEGFDPSSLRKGVGHIQGTAVPGGLGNMALAGHRDTFFRPLRNIRPGMTVSVITADGRYDYLVDSTEIVDPEQVRVLAIHDKPEMTLITCYPFDFIGAAPHRFIVHAHLKTL